MITDKQLILSDAQAVTTTAISTNVYDSGPLDSGNAGVDLGTGQTLYGFIFCDVILAGTSETLDITYISDSTANLATSPTTHYTHVQLSALAAGAMITFALPPGNSWERYSGFKFTTGGTSPTVTLTAGIVADVSVLKAYASGLNFSAGTA